MRARAAATTAVVGAVTTWVAAPWVVLALGGSLDDTARARMRTGRAAAPTSFPAPVVPLRPRNTQPTRTTWAAVPSPRPAADAVRVSRVG
jgi:hypothetical protein